jgi:peptidoglycan/LPS O-acetylase OafA/YrhL
LWRKRIRRLLPPFWVFGAVALAVSAALGRSGTEEAEQPFTWRRLALVATAVCPVVLR